MTPPDTHNLVRSASMPTAVVSLTQVAEAALRDLAARTGRPPAALVEEAVVAYRAAVAGGPVAAVPGVDPADVWAAAADADAGRLTPHADVFARLRARP